MKRYFVVVLASFWGLCPGEALPRASMSLLSTGDFAPRALSFNNRRVKKVLCTVFISGVFLIPQFVFALTLVEYRNPALLSQQEINIRWQLRDTNLTEVQRRALEDLYSAFP